MQDAWNTAKGWFGYAPEQKVGKDIGRYLGQLGSEYIPIPGINGSQFGEWVGSFLPFQDGGVVDLDRKRQLWDSYVQNHYGGNPGVMSNPDEIARVTQGVTPFQDGGVVDHDRQREAENPVNAIPIWFRKHVLSLKDGGLVPRSVSNVRAQMLSEGFQGYMDGGVAQNQLTPAMFALRKPAPTPGAILKPPVKFKVKTKISKEGKKFLDRRMQKNQVG